MSINSGGKYLPLPPDLNRVSESGKDIMTKFKSQALYVKRIKYCKAGGSGNPPSLIPALWNIKFLLHIEATRAQHFEPD